MRPHDILALACSEPMPLLSDGSGGYSTAAYAKPLMQRAIEGAKTTSKALVALGTKVTQVLQSCSADTSSESQVHLAFKVA